jgi:hypothetical protein
VLLHGLLLLAFNTSHRNGNTGRKHDEHANWNALIVRLPDSENNTLHAISTTDTAEVHTAPSSKKTATQPGAVVEKTADGLPEPLAPAPTQPYAPDQRYQAQMNYQQMQAMRALQQAHEQRQLTISNLQADIEQKLNRQDTHANGRCAWQRNKTDAAPDLRCEPKSLANLMQDNRKNLLALRSTLHMQGLVMDGFTVSIKENRSVIDYLLHAPNASTSP